MEKIKKWWLQLLVLVAMIIAMLMQDTDYLYVAPAVWYALIGALAFCIFSIFKWG